MDLLEMNKTNYKIINDSAHGHITLHRLCIKIIDTVEFQRLRNIKQLGVANLVYPGAGHSRFEHSLGVCHLARQMMVKLLENDQQWTERLLTEESNLLSDRNKLCVEIAGLCHDLGHGPFSHTWERIVHRWRPEDKWKHEKKSLEIFENIYCKLKDDFIKDGIEMEEKNLIKNLIAGNTPNNPKEQFLYEIVANSINKIDVDKWDYLYRDGKYLNLSSTFDYHRLLEMCAVVKYGETYHIAFRDKVINTLYDMFRTRAEFHYKAYQHLVVKNIETMYIDAFEILHDYCINGSKVQLKQMHNDPDFVKLTDHIFYEVLYSTGGSDNLKAARNLFERVCNRHLYKLIGKREFQDVENVNLEERTLVLIDSLRSAFPNLYENFKYNDFQTNMCVFDENNAQDKIWLYEKVVNNNACVAKPVLYRRNMLNYPIERTPIAELLLFYDGPELSAENLETISAILNGL